MAGTIYPGLIELHNHLAYNALQLWDVPKRYGNRDQWAGIPEYRKRISGPMKIIGVHERIGLPELPEGDFNTMAGFVLLLFGRIPAVNERIDWSGWSFEVANMDGWRIDKVIARHTSEAESATASM